MKKQNTSQTAVQPPNNWQFFKSHMGGKQTNKKTMIEGETHTQSASESKCCLAPSVFAVKQQSLSSDALSSSSSTQGLKRLSPDWPVFPPCGWFDALPLTNTPWWSEKSQCGRGNGEKPRVRVCVFLCMCVKIHRDMGSRSLSTLDIQIKPPI